MPVTVRSADRSLRLDATPDGLRADDAPLDARLSPLGGGAHVLMLGERPRVVTVEPGDNARTRRVTLGGTTVTVEVLTDADLLRERFGVDDGAAAAGREVKAPMPGLVLRLLVAPGDRVAAGQGLVVLEAMKMENELTASADAVVVAVHASPGEAVAKNALLVTLAPPDEA